jgi:hypothetical protein
MYAHIVDISDEELKIKDKKNYQHKSQIYEIELDSSEMLKYLFIDIYYLVKLGDFFMTSIKTSLLRKIQDETIRRQDIWKKVCFVNDKTNAVSAI